MKTRFIACCILSFFAFLAPGQAGGDVIYVSPEGSHVPPFDSLQNAATNIHEAVESATDGAEVLIYPGHYVLTNTLVLINAISLKGIAMLPAAAAEGSPCEMGAFSIQP